MRVCVSSSVTWTVYLLYTDFKCWKGKGKNTMNAQDYAALLQDHVNLAYYSKCLACQYPTLSCFTTMLGCRLQNSHIRHFTNLVRTHWNIPPPSHNPALSPCDYHIFRPLKETLWGQHFLNDDAAETLGRFWNRPERILQTRYKKASRVLEKMCGTRGRLYWKILIGFTVNPFFIIEK